MRIDGIYLPNGWSENRAFSVRDDSASVSLCDGSLLELTAEVPDRAEGDFSVSFNPQAGEGEPVLFFSGCEGSDQQGRRFRVSVYRNGDCSAQGFCHANADSYEEPWDLLDTVYDAEDSDAAYEADYLAWYEGLQGSSSG